MPLGTEGESGGSNLGLVARLDSILICLVQYETLPLFLLSAYWPSEWLGAKIPSHLAHNLICVPEIRMQAKETSSNPIELKYFEAATQIDGVIGTPF